jgi:transcription antitermination factor NusG
MPILKKETDIFPSDLFESGLALQSPTKTGIDWWCVYTVVKREKDLTRKLAAMKIPHYAPVVPKRYRSPNGRLRTSYIPLFANYVFMLANEDQRYHAMTTNCIRKCSEVKDYQMLVDDLTRIHTVVSAGVPLTAESKLASGDKVKVRSGPFAGYAGIVLRREGKTRLLLSIRFLEEGVSMAIDEGLLEVVERVDGSQS